MKFSRKLNQEGPLYIFNILRSHKLLFPNKIVFLSLKIILQTFDLANSADPDEMPQNAAFHLGLQCLPNNLFWGFPVYKRLSIDTIGFSLVFGWFTLCIYTLL